MDQIRSEVELVFPAAAAAIAARTPAILGALCGLHCAAQGGAFAIAKTFGAHNSPETVR